MRRPLNRIVAAVQDNDKNNDEEGTSEVITEPVIFEKHSDNCSIYLFYQ